MANAERSTSPDVQDEKEDVRPANPGSTQPPAVTYPGGLTMPPLRACCYFAASIVLALAQGFGQNQISANIQQAPGAFGTTQAETLWFVAAYMAPNVSLTLALIKIRGQFGLRRFAEISIVVFLLAALLNYVADGFWSNVAVRFLSGAAAASMTSLAFLYMLEPLPPQRKLNVGLSAALTFIFMGSALTRLISPHLFDAGLWPSLTALEASLAAIGLGMIYLFPLLSPPQPMKIEAGDIISFLFVAIGFGCLAVAAVTGSTYWWTERAWLGWVLAAGIASITIAACLELNRERPFLDIRWLVSPGVLHFAGALLLFRLVLSEQTSGAAGLLRTLGMLNEQSQGLWLVIIGGTIAGGAICAVLLKPGREVEFHVIALSLLIAGSLMDANSTSATLPSDMYLSQAMIALASALFLPPAMLSGLMAALAKGPNYLLTFIIVFLTTQKIGGIFGSALFSSFVQIRQKLHTQRLYETLTATNPLVTERISTWAKSLSPAITDSTYLSAQAAAQLAGEVKTQAGVLAYNDAFLAVAAISTAALILLLGHAAIRALNARRQTTQSEQSPDSSAEPQAVRTRTAQAT